MIYLDTNIFIYALAEDQTLEEAQKSTEYLNKLVIGYIECCTNYLTWDEVVYITLRDHGREKAVEIGKYLLLFPNLKFLDANDRLVEKAQTIINQFNINPRDAIHAASSLEYCSGEMISNDQDFDVINGIRRRF